MRSDLRVSARHTRRVVLAAALITAVATPVARARAQRPSSCNCAVATDTSESDFQRRSGGSFDVIQSRPRGDFAHNVGLGYGGGAAYLFRLDRAGYLGLRVDGGFLEYGSESKRVPLSETIGGRIQVNVSTDNYLVPIAFGPELAWPTGSVRPYVNGGIGGQFFYTESSVRGTDGTNTNLSTTNQHDQTFSWVLGGGVGIPVYTKGMTALIDVGVQYFTGGHARYLRPGSIVDLPDAQIQINALESDTRMVVARFGVRLFAR